MQHCTCRQSHMGDNDCPHVPNAAFGASELLLHAMEGRALRPDKFAFLPVSDAAGLLGTLQARSGHIGVSMHPASKLGR